MHKRGTLALTLVVSMASISLLACGDESSSDTPAEDTGTGSEVDGGNSEADTEEDTNTDEDVGNVEDIGSDEDSGTEDDSGTEEDSGTDDDSGTEDDTGADEDTGGSGGIETCDDLASVFVNAPDSVRETECALENGSTTTCCELTFGSDLMEDGPYCPPSLTSPPPYGLSVYDGDSNPGLRPFNGDYLRDIEADGYDAMVDSEGNTNIVTTMGAPPASGSNCLAMDQNYGLTITVNIPLVPTQAASPSTIESVENIGVSVYGVPATGDPPSATMGPMGMPGPGGSAINVPSIGACGAHPDPAGYLHDHFIPQVMNSVLAANGISPSDVECTTYEQSTTALYGFAKDGYPIYSSRDSEDALPDDLDSCNGHSHATSEYPDGVYHYHADEEAAPNYMDCLSGVAVRNSFSYR